MCKRKPPTGGLRASIERVGVVHGGARFELPPQMSKPEGDRRSPPQNYSTPFLIPCVTFKLPQMRNNHDNSCLSPFAASVCRFQSISLFQRHSLPAGPVSPISAAVLRGSFWGHSLPCERHTSGPEQDLRLPARGWETRTLVARLVGDSVGVMRSVGL